MGTQNNALLSFANCRYLPSITGYSQHHEICAPVETNCPVEMNIPFTAFRLVVVEYDPVDFIFTWLLYQTKDG